MQLQPRSFFAALGMMLAPLAASAQHIQLLTEAPVTFTVTFNTSITTSNNKTGSLRVDTTKAYSSVIGNPEILDGLKSAGLITTPTTAGWRLVAVRGAPTLYQEINSDFYLYAINETVTPATRVAVPSSKFLITSTFRPFPNDSDYVFSVANATMTHSVRNPVTAVGVNNNYAEMSFTPSFTRKEVPGTILSSGTETVSGRVYSYNIVSQTTSAFTIGTLNTTGMSAISFTASSALDPVFFYAIGSMTYTSRGDFTGSLLNTTSTIKRYTTRNVAEVNQGSVTDSASTPASGLVNVRVTLTPAKLVDASLYPAVSY